MKEGSQIGPAAAWCLEAAHDRLLEDHCIIGFKNWHKENLDGTRKALTELGK